MSYITRSLVYSGLRW